MTQASSFYPTSLREWQRLYDRCPMGVAACDESGRYLFANPAYAAIYGYAPRELTGKTFYEVKTSEAKLPVQENLLSTLLEKQTPLEPFEKWDLRRDGTQILVRYHIDYLLNEAGAAYGSVVFIQDVTQRQKRDDRLLLLEQQLQQNQKLSSLGRIAGGVVHDFNNRLNVILGLTSVLRMQNNLPPAQMDMVADIIAASRQAAELTQRLLLFSRESIKKAEVCDLQEVIRQSVLLARRLVMQPIDWQESCTCADPRARLDRVMVQNALFNILLNASEAMPEGGTIRITLDDVTQSGKRWLRMEVRDEGCGISPEIIDKVFDPFFSTKTSAKGTGLGLAAAKQGVEENGGEIRIRSNPGEGTCVTLCFPCAEECDADAPVGSMVVPGRGGALRILVVDDEEDVLKSVLTMLEALGHRGHGFRDSASACHFYERFHGQIDFLLLDIMLPSMSGIDLLEKLMAIYNRNPVLLMSGYTMQHISVALQEASAAPFLHKPFTAEELSSALTQAGKRTAGGGGQPPQA